MTLKPCLRCGREHYGQDWCQGPAPELSNPALKGCEHEWAHSGGRNAGCCDDCHCSIPVFTCAKCGDCDYGNNPEAQAKVACCQDPDPLFHDAITDTVELDFE